MTAAPRVAVAAAIPLTRAVTWGPLAAGSLVGLAVVGWLGVRDAGVAAQVGGLRIGAVLLAAGAAFALDDTAAATLASSPTPLSARRALRLTMTLGICVAVWAAMLGVAGDSAVRTRAGLTVELVGMVAVAFGGASVAARWAPNGLGGLAGGPILLFVMLTATIIQMHWPHVGTLLPVAPGTPGWEAAHVRWLVLAGGGVALVALAALDPARRLPSARWR
ncbi:MAG: hypothetical protein ACR2KK_01345 [Acidimicrobiales bacterium]